MPPAIPRFPALSPLLALLALFVAQSAGAETLIRWDQDSIPSPQALGISSVVIPASRAAAIRAALVQGYRVQVEIAAADAPGYSPIGGAAGLIVRGAIAPDQVSRLVRLVGSSGSVRVAEDRGKWPHIRTNWVTRNKDVLQVTNRSAQPWLENNGALIRIGGDPSAPAPVLLTYSWQPVTISDLDQGPRLENYLVAMAEAGSFGADLLLPLHERFEQALLAGLPDARAEWAEIRQFIEFYAWNVPLHHQAMASIAVVTADPMRSFETLNLLTRHNLPFTVVPPSKLDAPASKDINLLLVLDALDEGLKQRVQAFAAAAKARVVERAEVPADPNTFALEMRQLIGRERRVVDIWNGITVLVAPYSRPNSQDVVLTAVNYAAQPLPIQVRVRGSFSEVQYEGPGERPVLLPFEVREGGTEFVLPALKIAARIFLHPAP